MTKPPKKPEPVPEPPIKFVCIICGREYKEISEAINCTHGK